MKDKVFLIFTMVYWQMRESASIQLMMSSLSFGQSVHKASELFSKANEGSTAGLNGLTGLNGFQDFVQEKKTRCQCRHHQQKHGEKKDQNPSFLEAKNVFRIGK